MVDNKNEEQLIKEKVSKDIESINIPNGLKDQVWQQVKPTKPNRIFPGKIAPYLAMAACLIILIPLTISQLSKQSPENLATDLNQTQTPTNQPTDQTETPNDKDLAKSFLEEKDFTVKTFLNEKSLTLSDEILTKNPELSIELQMVGAYYLDNDFVMRSESLMNKQLTIETFEISGHWREKYINQAQSTVGVVLLNHEVLGGFTIPRDGESEAEGIWPFYGPKSDAVIKVDNEMSQKDIAKKLFSMHLDKLKTIDRIDEQISNYKIESILAIDGFHGINFKVQYRVLPAQKEKFAIAGGMMPLDNGWVQNNLSGQIYKITEDTYGLLGVGGGPVTDINSNKYHNSKSDNRQLQLMNQGLPLTGPNIFDPLKVNVGDVVNGLSLTSINVYPGTSSYPYDTLTASFKGEVLLTGSIQHTSMQYEFFPDSYIFFPDEKSSLKLPKSHHDLRKTWLLFDNQEEVNKAFEIPQGETKEQVTVKVNNYHINYLPKEVADTATFIK